MKVRSRYGSGWDLGLFGQDVILVCINSTSAGEADANFQVLDWVHASVVHRPVHVGDRVSPPVGAPDFTPSARPGRSPSRPPAHSTPPPTPRPRKAPPSFELRFLVPFRSRNSGNTTAATPQVADDAHSPGRTGFGRPLLVS